MKIQVLTELDRDRGDTHVVYLYEGAAEVRRRLMKDLGMPAEVATELAEKLVIGVPLEFKGSRFTIHELEA